MGLDDTEDAGDVEDIDEDFEFDYEDDFDVWAYGLVIVSLWFSNYFC